jgi:ABC-type transporter Mla subunit MlaD
VNAGRRGQLAAAVRGLPGLLTQARPTLTEASRLAQAGTPSIQALGRAAPDVNRLISQLDATAPRIRPTVAALGSTARATTGALPSIAPQIKRLRGFAAQAPKAASLLAPLLTSLRDRGATEGLQSFLYFAVAATARYDKISHMLPAYAIGTSCAIYTTVPIPGCDAHSPSNKSTAAAPRKATPKPARPAPSTNNSALLDYLLGK